MLRKRKKTGRRRSGRGSVMLLATLFVGSAILRIGTGAGSAIAEGHEKVEAALASDAHEIAEGPAHAQALDRTDMTTLLYALQEREARVTAREKQIAMRTKALAVANTEIQKRLVVLEQTEEALRATLSLADSAAENDIAKLTAVYENMKPKDAAALFEAMEPKFAAGFLGRMRPDAAAAIMTGLTPESAYTISVILAGRNAKVPKT